MAAENVARVRRPFLTTLLILGVAACAPQSIPEDAFRIKLNECERDMDACKTQCAPPTSDSRTCDAVLVLQVEDFLYSHEMPLPVADEQVQKDLKRICDAGIGRACAANLLLAAEIERNATLRASDNVDVRAGELERQALAIASLSAPGFTSCSDTSHPQTPTVHAACNARDLAVAARRCMSGCDTCSPGCKVELDNAETAFNAAQKLAMDATGAAQANKAAVDEKTAKERVVMDALTSDLQAREDVCLADLPTCKKSCAAAAPTSMACGFLAIGYATGKGGTAIDVKEATRLARAGCAASASPNKVACAAQKHLEAEAKRCSGDTCKRYCDAAKCGYSPGGICLYGDACARAGSDLLTASKDNGDQASPLFDKGCAVNSGHSCAGLGALYLAGTTSVPADTKKAESTLKKACDIYTAEMRHDPGRVGDPEAFAATQGTCKSYESVECVNKVQSAARRRPAKDAACTGAGLPATAWATLNGTDADSCTSAMTGRGCQVATGQGVYCCPP